MNETAVAVPCPECTAPVPGGEAACPSCALPLTGAAARRLWEVDQTIGRLQQERRSLLHQLRSESGNGPAWGAEPHWAAPGSPWAPAQERKPGMSGQQVLLGLGALLVAVAAVVFLAVAWSVLGTFGQVAAIGVVTALVLAGSCSAARRSLSQTAEALGWLGGALVVFDLAAARTLGLVPEDAISATGYAAVSAGVTALVLGAMVALERRVAAYGVLSVAASQLIWPFAAAANDAPWQVVVGGVVVQAWLTALLSRTSVKTVRVPAAVAATVTLTVAAVVATALSVSADDGRSGYALLALLAAASGLVWTRMDSRADFLATSAGVVAGGQLVNLGNLGSEEIGVFGVAFLLTVLAAGLSFLARNVKADGTTGFAVTALTTGLCLSVAVLASSSSYGLLTLLFLAGAGSVLVAAWGRRWDDLLVAGATLLTLLSLGAFLADLTVEPGPAGLVITFAGVLVAAGAWTRKGRLEVLLGAQGLGALVVGASVSAGVAEQSPGWLSACLFAAGLTLLAYGVRPQRGWAATVGAPVLSAGSWVLLADAGVQTVEAYSLPLALVVLGIGLVRRQRDPEASSWAVWGPATALALLPSAQVAAFETGLLRPTLVLVASALVLLVAVRFRQQGPLLAAGVAALEVGLSQLAPYADLVPRWVLLATVGTVLLVAGATYEARVRDVRRAVEWVAQLK